MKRLLSLIVLTALFAFSAQAQKYISGMVIDSASGKPLGSVTVQNLTSKYGTKTNYRGSFTIEVNNDHYLQFSAIGYKSRIVRIREIKDIDVLKIRMVIGRTELKAVKISKPLTQYQRDSIERAEIYRDIHNYKQSKSIFSPVSTVQQIFSKKHKHLRKFKEQVQDMEQQKFIDSRYTPELAQKVTKLSGDDLAFFMNAYPMPFDYARQASELEIYSWIARNWAEYQQKNQGKE